MLYHARYLECFFIKVIASIFDFVCMYARGRRIPHTHIFLVPTYSGDVLDRFFNALELFQESPPKLAALREERSMKDTADLIRKAETQ